MASGSRSTDFFFYIYNLHVFKQKVNSHQVLIYLDVPGIPAKSHYKTVDRATGCVKLCANFLTRRHLLINKKDKNSRYNNLKIMII